MNVDDPKPYPKMWIKCALCGKREYIPVSMWDKMISWPDFTPGCWCGGEWIPTE